MAQNFSFDSFNAVTKDIPPLLALYCIRNLVKSIQLSMITYNNDNLSDIMKISVAVNMLLESEKEKSDARKAAKAKTE